ncbi:MAG: hemerythrin domain-containing protein [Promethearchaeota archaeon]
MSQSRFDVYGSVHKGLRYLMTELMYELGRADVNNASELTSLGKKLQYLWDILIVHAAGEEEFIFPHLEREDKTIFTKLKRAHDKFHEQIEFLREDFKKITGTNIGDIDKVDKMYKFTKQYNTFLSQYFSHMQDEELEANPILWKILSDKVLMDILIKMSSKPTPELRQYFLPYLLKATNHSERVGVLMGMRKGMPETIFSGILNIAEASLEEFDWQKLKQTLDSLVQVH